MRVLRASSSIFVYWEDLVYLEAALLAHPDTVGLAAAVTATLQDFPGLLQTDLDSRRSQVQAEARVALADGRLDDGIRDVHSDSVHLARGDYGAPTHRALFKQDIGRTVRHALARQLEVAQALVSALTLPLFSPEFRERQQARLGGLIEAGKAALEGRRTATLGRAGVRLTLQEWKEEANAVRTGTYGQLVQLKADKKFADQFFRPAPAPGAQDGADPEDSPEGELEG